MAVSAVERVDPPPEVPEDSTTPPEGSTDVASEEFSKTLKKGLDPVNRGLDHTGPSGDSDSTEASNDSDSTDASDDSDSTDTSDNSDSAKSSGDSDSTDASDDSDPTKPSSDSDPTDSSSDSENDIPEGPQNEEEFRANAEENGWTVVEENDELPPMESVEAERQDDSTVTYDYQDETFAVSAHISPFKYGVLEGEVSGAEISQSDNNIESEIPDSAATDFMMAETTEDDKTVGELFHDNMEEKWGELELSDPRRQYFELVEARSALTSGFHYLPNSTDEGALGNGDDTATLPERVVLDDASTYGLLKEEEIDAQLTELLENEDVVHGVDQFMEDAVDKIKDKPGLTNKIYDSMTSPEYMEELEAMGPDGSAVRFSNDIESLEMLDPDKAAEVRSTFFAEGFSEEITEKLKSGDVNPEDLDVTSSPWSKVLLQSIGFSTFAASYGDSALTHYKAYLESGGKEGGDKLTPEQKSLADGNIKAQKMLSDAVADGLQAGKMDEDLTRHVANHISKNLATEKAADRAAAGYLKAGLQTGMIPGIGSLAFAGAALQTFMGAGDDGEISDEEILALTRGMIVGATSTPLLLGGGSAVLEGLFNKPGVGYMLGLTDGSPLISDTLREKFPKMFEQPKTLGETKPSDPSKPDDKPQNITAADIPGFIDGFESGEKPTPDQANAYTNLIDAVEKSPDAPDLDLARQYMEDLTGESDNIAGQYQGTYQQLDDLKQFIANYKSTGPNDPIQRAINNLVRKYNLSLPGNELAWFDDVSRGKAPERTSSRINISDFLNPSNRPTISLNLDTMVENIKEDLDGAQDKYGNQVGDAMKDFTPEERRRANRTIDDILEKNGQDPTRLATHDKYRWVGTLMNAGAGIADTAGGFIDVALGAMSIEKLNEEGASSLEKAPAILQIINGSSYGLSAGSSFASMVVGGSVGSVLGMAAGGLGLVGTGAGVISMIISGAVAKKQKENDIANTREQLETWDKLDIMEEDWGDKFNYAQNARYIYFGSHGSEDYFELYPEDKPVWEARPEQYKDFTEYLNDHSSLSDDWFSDWDDEHGIEISGFRDDQEHEGAPVLGSDKKSNKPDKGAGTFEDFKEDIDKVDIESIEFEEDGWIHFEKDGYEQSVRAGAGAGWDNDSDSYEVVDYLTDLYEITHPNGEKDEDIIERVEELFAESDKYNDIDELQRVLSDDFVQMLGKDDDKPGTFRDFRRDVDRVDVSEIELDPGDSSVIYFEKDGERWMLDKDDNGSLDGDDADDIYTYLHELHDLIRPDGENIDKEVFREVREKHDDGNRYNKVDQMREHLVETFPEKYGEGADPFGISYDEEGSVEINDIGTFDDFVEDVDKVDVGSIAISDDSQSAVFEKDGRKQRISGSDETNTEIIEYLTGLEEIVGGDKDRAQELNDLLGATDDFNGLDSIDAYMNPRKPTAWADKTPVNRRDELLTVPNQDQDEFKEDMNKVDAASIRVVDDVVYFMKNGEWHQMGPGYGGDMRHIYNQLVMVANMTDDGKDLKLAARIDQIWDMTDDYNEANELEDYLEKIGAIA